MAEDVISRMRKLRKRARDLNAHLTEDLTPFLHDLDQSTFRRLPDAPSKEDDIGVTTTCSCLMALATATQFSRFFGSNASDKAKASFEKLLSFPRWTSSALPPANAFTSTLVLRAFSFLVGASIYKPESINSLRHHEIQADGDGNHIPEMSLSEILHKRLLGGAGFSGLKIGNYRTAAPVVYWLVDAVHRANAKLKKNEWAKLVDWARQEFTRQVSLTVAKHDALKDPVSMAMAACLCAMLRRLANTAQSGSTTEFISALPSNPELEFSIRAFFGLQEPSGIWPKYFPLFHYPNAGANYCFTFELLEAILREFGAEDQALIEDEVVFSGFEKAVWWCEEYRLEHRVPGGGLYCGWNSGGQFESLSQGMPESWATAVVHMFLWQLHDVLSRIIRHRLLVKYGASGHLERGREDAWDNLVDISVQLPNPSGPQTIKTLLSDQIIKHASKHKDGRSLINEKLSGRVSALLFGPPGTSKTQLAKAVAGKLGWPFVSISPSVFLDQGLEQIYIRANGVFEDLMDLPGTVILFDEMDALVRAREENAAAPLDVTSRFLTTSMLPWLADLHDERRAVFFMATNHQNSFDPAVKRPGRFDLLICVGPPRWKEKLAGLASVLKGVESVGDIGEVKSRLEECAFGLSGECEHVLDLFTFKELRTFLEEIAKDRALGDELARMEPAAFRSRVTEFAKHTTLRAGSPVAEQYEKDQKESQLQ